MRLIRWMLRFLMRGRVCEWFTVAAPDARLVALVFRDPFGFHYSIHLSPDEARDFAWKMIGAADDVEAGCF